MPRVLVLSPMFPSFRHQGNNARLAAVLEYFRARQFEIHLAVLCRRPWRTFKPEDYRQFADEVYLLEAVGRDLGAEPTPVLSHLCRSPRGLAKWLHGWTRPRTSLAAEVAALAGRLAPQVLWTNYVHLSPLLTGLANSNCLSVIDTHDVMHLRVASMQAAGLADERPITRDQEAAWLRRADAVVAIQTEERNLLAQMLPDRTVIEVGRALDVRPLSSVRNSVAFVASNYSANLHGLELFLREAWPAIAQACPAARLEIIGTIGQNRVVREYARRDASLILRGVAPTLPEVYDGPAAMVCPLWAGSGLKQKVVEALGYGKAVVASPVAAQGLEDGIDRAFLLAERPADFIEPVVRLLRSQSQRTACEQAALRYARQKFTPDVVYAELDALLQHGSAAPVALRHAA